MTRSKTRWSRGIRALSLVVIVGAFCQAVAKRMTFGDEQSEAFRRAAIFGGKELKSSATALRSASALAVLGGVEIDLREASLDPAGATLDVTAVLGGVEVRLPTGWLVEVRNHGKLGGVETRLTDSAEHVEGAPTLRVSTYVLLGGVEIRD